MAKLRGIECQKCGEFFSTSTAFDQHRIIRPDAFGTRLVKCDPRAAGMWLAMGAGKTVWTLPSDGQIHD